MYDVCVVGHVTLDRVERQGRRVEQPGGTAYYAGLTACRLGLSTAIVTRAAASSAWLVDELGKAGANVRLLPSHATTIFESRLTPDLEARSLCLISVAAPFSPADLANARARAIHLGPLSGNEMSREVIRAASKNAPFVLLDVQGLVRRAEPGPVEVRSRPDTREALSHVTALKTDLAEARHLTGEHDAEAAARSLARMGPREVLVTMGAAGSIVAAGSAVERVAAHPPARAIDSTGAGDCYAAGYITARLRGHDPPTSARFASAVAALKLEVTGPFAATVREAQDLANVVL